MNLQQLQSPALGEYKTDLVNSQSWNWGGTLAYFSKHVIIILCPKEHSDESTDNRTSLFVNSTCPQYYISLRHNTMSTLRRGTRHLMSFSR